MSEPKKLDAHQMESRKEVLINFNLKNLLKGYRTLFRDWPVAAYQKIARKVDSLAIHKNLRQGFPAALMMPLGIMVRNGARSAHQLSDGKYKHASDIIGGLGAAGAAGVTGIIAFKAVAAAGVPTVLAGIAAAIPAAAVIIPAFTIGLLASATVISLVVTVFSAVPAILNIKTGILRTWDRLRGIKGVNYDDAEAEREINEKSLHARYDRENFNKVNSGLHYLSDEGQKKIYESLKEKFEKPVEKKAAVQEDILPESPAEQVAVAAAPKTVETPPKP